MLSCNISLESVVYPVRYDNIQHRLVWYFQTSQDKCTYQTLRSKITLHIKEISAISYGLLNEQDMGI